jgi:hypothetical protein
MRVSQKELVKNILDDIEQSRLTGHPKKYAFPDEIPNGGKLMDMLLPNGKKLGDCTGIEVMAVGEAYKTAGKILEAKASAIEKGAAQ